VLCNTQIQASENSSKTTYLIHQLICQINSQLIRKTHWKVFIRWRCLPAGTSTISRWFWTRERPLLIKQDSNISHLEETISSKTFKVREAALNMVIMEEVVVTIMSKQNKNFKRQSYVNTTLNLVTPTQTTQIKIKTTLSKICNTWHILSKKISKL